MNILRQAKRPLQLLAFQNARTGVSPHSRHIAFDFSRLAADVEGAKINATRRKAAVQAEEIDKAVEHWRRVRSINTQIQALRTKRNSIKGPNAKDEGRIIKQELSALESDLVSHETPLNSIVSRIPNDTHPDSPIGNYHASHVIQTHDPYPPKLPSDPERDHLTIASRLGWVNFSAGTKTTGPSSYYLLNSGALLELALIGFAMSRSQAAGFSPTIVPDIVRTDIAERCGFAPRDPHAGQTFHIAESNTCLSATAEIPLAGYSSSTITPASRLPSKMVAFGRAFRAEAGARGHESRGLYRVHQFTKIELFVVSEPEASGPFLQEILELQTNILRELSLPFRVLDMATEELGASAYRKYDIEAWMPGRGEYGEVSSASNCTDYQSKRLDIRCKQVHAGGSKATTVFAHTLNATALAIPRIILALVENGVVFDSNNNPVAVTLPSCLRPFWFGNPSTLDIRWSDELGKVEAQ